MAGARASELQSVASAQQVGHRPGERAVAVAVSEQTQVGGLLQPGDRVDVLVTIHEKPTASSDQQFLHIQTVLQNVEVLAQAQTPIAPTVTLGPDGKPPGKSALATRKFAFRSVKNVCESRRSQL